MEFNATVEMVGKGAYNPNFMGSFINSRLGMGKEVNVQTVQRSVIWEAYMTETILRSAVDIFVKYVMMGGVELEVNVDGKVIKINNQQKEFKSYISMEFKTQMCRLIQDLVLYGYSRVCIVPSFTKDNFPSFVVLEEGTTKEKFHNDNYHRRIYTMLKGMHRVKTDKPEQESIPGGRLVILDHPDIKGNLTSPVYSAMSPLVNYTELWNNYMRSSIRSSRPPYIMSRDLTSSKRSNDETPLGGRVLSSHASLQGTRDAIGMFKNQFDQKEQEEYKQAIYAVNKYRSGDHDQTKHIPRVATHEAQRYRAAKKMDVTGVQQKMTEIKEEDPWVYGTLLPSGMKIQPVPKFSAPEKIDDMLVQLGRQVFSSVGVPADMFSSTHDRFAKNLEDIYARLRTNVHSFQERIKPILEYFFKNVFVAMIDPNVYDVQQKDFIELGMHARDRMEKAAKEAADLYTKANNEEMRDVEREIEMSKSASAYKEAKENEEFLRIILKLKENIEKVDVTVTFVHNPSIVSFDELERYYEAGIIKSEVFQEYAIKSASMPEEAKEPNMDKAREKRMMMGKRPNENKPTAAPNKKPKK